LKLKGQVAIITGAASGIGRASAVLFAREGARIVVADIKEDEANETVKMVKDAGGEAIFFLTNVTLLADLEKMVKAAVDAYGRLDILFNNAGIAGPTFIEETSEEAFNQTVAVNLKAGFFGTKFAIPEMRKSGGGCILFTSSGLGMRAFPQSLVYSLTKAALNMLTRGLAVQLGRDNIRVNAVCPGPVDTTVVYKDMASSQENPQKTNEDRPIARYGTVEEMAEAALFLAAPESAYITGVALPVDGGGVAK